MAAYISFQPSDYFNTVLYTGNGSTQTISGVGIQPDMTWIKERNGTEYHRLYDAVRGATKEIYPNASLYEATNANSLTSWNADGFALGTETGVNNNSDTYVAWNWKMGTTTGLSGGDITPTGYSFTTTAAQSVIGYTGTGSPSNIPHGCGAVVKFLIIKEYSHDTNWAVYNEYSGNTAFLQLNTDAAAASTNNWNDTTPTSTVFRVASGDQTNNSGRTYIAYCFANVRGYSKFGYYEGNGNVNGPFAYTGFRPAVVIRKRANSSNDWYITDNKRLGYNPKNAYLFPNTTQTESDIERIDFLSNGFKIRTTDSGDNASGEIYIYMAFAEFPVVSSNSKAGTAR